MNEQNDQTSTNPVGAQTAVAPAAGLSRRAILSGAGKAAVPAIITLYSGASLARSSNLIGANPRQGADGDKFRCLDTRSVDLTEKANVYDLGQDPMAHVTRISTRRRYFRPRTNGAPSTQQVSGNTMCADGGDFYRQGDNGYRKVTVQRGMLVSATALSSFANDITYTDV